MIRWVAPSLLCRQVDEAAMNKRATHLAVVRDKSLNFLVEHEPQSDGHTMGLMAPILTHVKSTSLWEAVGLQDHE